MTPHTITRIQKNISTCRLAIFASIAILSVLFFEPGSTKISSSPRDTEQSGQSCTNFASPPQQQTVLCQPRLCPSISRGRTFTADYETFFGEFGGDQTRYGLHPYLTSKSLVIEVGGYTGVDILAMHKLYGAFRTFLFEPVFFKEAKNNLNEVPNIRLFPYGLGNSSRMVHFDVMGDGTKPSQQGTGQQVEIADFREVLQKLRINHVDLLQINCEGCEWEVLETVIGSREVANTFGRIQVQFHPGAEWVDNKLERYAVIQDKLTQTHSLVYDQPWIWQMWQRNDLISL